MVNSVASSRAPSRQASASLRSLPATPEALTPHAASRDASATDLVRLASQFDADEVARHLKAAGASSGSQTSSVAEWQERMQLSSFEAARRRQTANAAGQAAGALNADVSVPELVSASSPQQAAEVSGRPSDAGSGPGDLRAGSARSTASDRTSTWLSRVTAKSDDLRSVFGLPDTENIMDDFICALQKKLLLQGRMYVFEHYVCFHSNVFGYVKNKAIPLKEVTAVRKRKNVGFPNSIEITWGPKGRKEFFTSFLSREDAFRLIVAAWHQSAPEKAEAQMFSNKRRKPERLAQSESALSPAGRNNHDEGSASATAAPGDRESFLSRSAALLKKGGLRRMTDRGGASQRERGAALGSLPANDTNGHPATAARASVTTDNSWQEEEDRSVSSSNGSPTTPGHDTDDDGHGDSDVAGEMWTPLDRPPPPLADGMQPLVTGELRGITMAELCTRFLSDESSFYVDFHHAKGDEQASISRWRTHQPLGRVRELQFITALKSRIGPPKTMCYQTQRYAMYESNQLVFETSQVMPDIPYGDCFTVEARWNITEAVGGSGPALKIATHVMVDFTKATIWKKAIESGVINSCRSSHEEWLAAAQKAIDEAAQQASPKQAAAAPASGLPAAAASQYASARGPGAPAPSLGAPPGSPAHLAALVELLPREHRAAVGRLLTGDGGASNPASPVSRRRSAGAGARLRDSAAGGRGSPRGLLTRRQWVLFSLVVAVVALQLLILWRFATLAAGSGVSGSAQTAAAVVRPVIAQPGQSAVFTTTGDVGQTAVGDAAGWDPRLQLLAADVDVMRQRLELLAADVATAVTATAGGPVAMGGSVAGDSAGGSCLAGACTSDA